MDMLRDGKLSLRIGFGVERKKLSFYGAIPFSRSIKIKK